MQRIGDVSAGCADGRSSLSSSEAVPPDFGRALLLAHLGAECSTQDVYGHMSCQTCSTCA